MIEDRDYMRFPGPGAGISLCAWLTIVLVAVFAFQCIDDAYLHTSIQNYLALTEHGMSHGWVWQLLTFQFLHLNIMHLLMNLISFWWLGHFAENGLGRKRFLVALFGCGAVGGLLQGSLMILFPSAFGSEVVGASAGVSGLLAIYCLLERNSEVRLYFFLPVPAIVLLWIWGGISLFFTLVPSNQGGGIAHAAHLGGLLAGIAWVKLGWHHDFVPLPWERWFQRREGTSKPTISTQSLTTSSLGGAKSDPASDVPDIEVDAILDKISARGINSLTPRERATLETARRKMARR